MASKNLSTPTDPPWQALKLSKNHLKDLKTQWSILHLLHHRSKNQHRRSAWYRHFSSFRKQLHRLLDDLDPDVASDVVPSQRSTLFSESTRKVEARLKFWAEVLVIKWWKAFAGLVADTQFAVIGLALLAGLGRVVKVLGLLERMKKVEAEAVRSGLPGVDEQAVEGGSDDLGTVIERRQDDADEDDANMGDFGVAIERSNGQEVLLPSDERNETQDGVYVNESTVPRKKLASKKKRKRAGDEIDDLFAGLL